MGRLIERLAGMVALVLLLPAAVAAQASITGVVKDTSGAVLPGVTVEATSPALIEKVRSVITDGTGQYRIVSLPPGTYSVTFTLTGFSGVRRDAVALTGTFVATVNADLRVSAVEETITVTGEAPTVDVQSTRREEIITREVLDVIPHARTTANLTTMIPGIQTVRADIGGSGGTSNSDIGTIHGGRYIDGRSLTNGLSTAHGNGGSGTGNLGNVAGASETVVTTSGGLAEAETSGVIVNTIPRDGGNRFAGSFYLNGANGSMQASNYTQELKDRGLGSPAELWKIYDFNPQGGGPILRDRLWFYLTERRWGNETSVPGMWFNKNAGDPTKWTYEPDLDRPAFTDSTMRTHVVNLTWQATARNKLGIYWSEQYSCERCVGGGTSTQLGATPRTPESLGIFEFSPSRVQQVTYSAPISNRFLVEAGFGTYRTAWGSGYREPNGTMSGETDGTHQELLVQVTEQGGSIPGLIYRHPGTHNRNNIDTRSWRASASYVTGAHSAKFGYYHARMPNGNPANITYALRPDFAYRFNNGVPNQVSIRGTFGNEQGARNDTWPMGLYAQDVWTRNRLTLQGGIRYDRTTTSHPDLRFGGTPIIPQELVIKSGESPLGYVRWNDISPRMGMAYDVFGTGKTAVKLNLGRYVDALSSLNENALAPLSGLSTNTNRSWNDSFYGVGDPRTANYVPDCDFTNRAANGECGANADQNLGTLNINRQWDPNYIHGWGVRPDNWEFSVLLNQEVVPRVSVSVGYFRRWFGNWYTTDNLAASAADYTAYYLTAPLDPRLPGGGGYQVGPLYDINPDKFGQINRLSTHSDNLAKQTENWNGFDVNVNARLAGLTLQGGTSTGKRYANNCDLRAVLPELGEVQNGLSAAPVPTTINNATPTNPWCLYEEPFLTRVAGLASYLIPKADVQVGMTFSSNPGVPPVGRVDASVAANWVVPNSVVRQSLGRDLSGGVQNVTVNLVQPGTIFLERLNLMDLRIAKVLRFGQIRSTLMADIYNVTNSATPVNVNETFVPGGRWLTPVFIPTARFVKLGVQVDF
jgi:hypothetical protein